MKNENYIARKKSYVNDGLVNRVVPLAELDRFFQMGFVRGRIYPSGRKSPVRTSEQKLALGLAISEAKLLYYKTDKGKLKAKEQGQSISKSLKLFFKTEKGKAQIEKSRYINRDWMLERISSGEFTPCITNSFTHWNAVIFLPDNEMKKFRSSWEACFWLCNQHLQYESLRIPYAARDGKTRNYLADFISCDGNTLYEIKPKSQWENQDNKMQQIIHYCLTKKIKFIWINEENILDYIDESKFDVKNQIQLNMLKKGLGRVNEKT